MAPKSVQDSRKRTYRIELTEQAQRSLKNLPSKAVDRIKRQIAELSIDPHLGKALSGEYEGMHSLRVWPYRVLYEIVRQRLVVSIIEIGHRQGIYK